MSPETRMVGRLRTASLRQGRFAPQEHLATAVDALVVTTGEGVCCWHLVSQDECTGPVSTRNHLAPNVTVDHLNLQSATS